LDAEITELLNAWGAGDQAALERLSEHAYRELRAMARNHMRNERQGRTLQATALVHEVYLRMIGVQKVGWQHRAQFFAMAAQMMRRILVDAARARGADKRGANAARVNFEETAIVSFEPDRSIIALDDALTAFSQVAPRQARVVELRYFGGLSEEEIVEVLNISPRSVRFDDTPARDENVGRHNVAMHDPGGMRSLERVQDGKHHCQDPFPENALPRHALLEGLALQKLHYKVRASGVISDVVNGADIGVVQGRYGLRFALEAFHESRVRGRSTRQEFYGYLASQTGVARPIDFPHATPSNRPLDLVGADGGSGHNDGLNWNLGSGLLDGVDFAAHTLFEQRFERLEAGGLLVQQRQDLAAKFEILTASGGDERISLIADELRGSVKEFLDSIEALAVHGVEPESPV
jgi:RNA polymerase sigma factor (TIGR02999 family)